MKNEILSERPNLFEPDSYIGMVLHLTGNITCAQLKEAVQTAYEKNETTMSKIVLTSDGRAYYEKMCQSGCTAKVEHRDYRELLVENKKKPFRLQDGELIRSFIIHNEKKITLLILAHHLAGDGKAITRFAKEVLDLLDGKEVCYHTSDIITKADFEQRGSLPRLIKLWVQRKNKKWKKTGRIFTWDDYEAIHETYWTAHDYKFQLISLDEEQLSELKHNARNEGVTVNSYLVAEILKQHVQQTVIGIPVSVREGNQAMNNMTSGIQIYYSYAKHKSIDWNARQIHKRIQKRLANKHIRYLAISFVSEIAGSFVDGVIMQRHAMYQSRLTQRMSKYMGYSGKTRTQLGITNLGVVEISPKYKEFDVEEFLFLPPKVSYADYIIGISTFREKVCIVKVR